MQLFAAAVASAVLMWAAFPPFNLGFLVFVAPAPLLWALRRARSLREAWWLGFTFGGIFWGGMLWWIFILGAVAWYPLTAVMAVFAALYGMLLYTARNWAPWRWWVVAVGGWAAVEFIRARFPLGGFPWGSLGFGVGTLAWPRGAAQWIGPTGWGVVAVAFAAGIVLSSEEEGDRRWLEMSAAVILVLTLAGAIWAPAAHGTAVRVAIVQGNSPCPRVHCENEKMRIYNSHLTLTRTLQPEEADLVVWGEDSFGGAFNPTFNPEVAAQMAGEAVRLDAYLLAGGTRPAGPGFFENLNVLFSPDGTIAGEYLKTHPVPFGEYVPVREIFEVIPQLDAVPNDMVRGTGPVVFSVTIDEEEFILGSAISFEGAFARTMRSEVKAGAQVMVVATNEGSYGNSPASDQLIGMVRMTAASLGVDVVHAAVTGRSTLIGADGSVASKTDLFTEDVVRGTVHAQESRKTLYAVVGDWLQVIAMIGAGILLAGYRRPRRDFKIKPGQRR
jgi:apolipoprotein N-acyltransferase